MAKNTNGSMRKDHNTSTSNNNNVSNENDKKDDEKHNESDDGEHNKFDEEHELDDGKHNVFDDEDDEHQEDELNKSELLFKTRCDNIYIDEEGATTIDASTQVRSDNIIAALKAVYTMIIDKFHSGNRLMFTM